MPKTDPDKPAYVLDLEAAYGGPSQQGFGSAVFFAPGESRADLEALAKKRYQHFVGHLWEEWGADTWLSPWRETYRRQATAKRNIEQELRGIEDGDTRMQVGMILDVVKNAQAAREALAAAYDSPDVSDLRAYLVGDGDAMSGLLVAGQRKNGDATFLVFIYD